MRGKLVTFEGIEASGKTTLSRMLFEWLRDNGYDAVFTRDPGGTQIGEKIRKILLDVSHEVDSLTEAFLYAAARRQLVVEVIRPALQRGSLVVCDRFSDSYLAYQGYGRCLSLNLVEFLNETATGGIKPDLTFLIDVPVEVAFSRKKEFDRLERENAKFHERVRTAFLRIAEENSERFTVLDGTKNLKELFKAVKERVLQVFGIPA